MEDSNSDPRHPRGVSRSLEKLARDPDDIVGLIAYGLYKFEQSEWARSATPSTEEVERHSDTLQTTRIESLQSTAKLKLSRYVASLQDQWRLEFYEEVKRDSMNELTERFESRLSAQVDALRIEMGKGFSFWRSLVTNVVAWLLTLAITTLILLAYFSPTVRLVPSP